MLELAHYLLIAGGLASIAIAILHLAVIYYGAPAYRYFGAGEKMATMAESGSLFPGFVTLGITIVFGVFGMYAFSGAQFLFTLPFLRIVLIGIGTIYTLRGLLVVSDLFKMLVSSVDIPAKDILFSLVSALIGMLYLAGSMRLID